MKEFYKSFLGGKITHENQYIAFISFDDEHHRVAILAVPGVKERDPGRCGLEVHHPLTSIFPGGSV
ncbi:hypothetical protein BDV06DRAFT_204626, partial [Aspergillus oleicola]